MNENRISSLTLLLFQESGIEYAINTSRIYEVVNRPPVFLPSPIPNCSGSIYYKGHLMPIFPTKEQDIDAAQQEMQFKSIIIFRLFFENKHHWIAFKASEIKGICSIDPEKIFRSDEWPMIQIPKYTKGLYFNKNRPVFLLEPTIIIEEHCVLQNPVHKQEDQSITI